HVAIEHRLMHAETLAYMFHQLPLDRKIAPPAISRHSIQSGSTTASPMVEIPGGEATLGMCSADREFGWDNEFEMIRQWVPAFAIDRYKVSNGDYRSFVDAGGYSQPELWTPENWAWKTENALAHPAFWRKGGQGWLYRTMFDEIALPLDWPVYVSHAEASA